MPRPDTLSSLQKSATQFLAPTPPPIFATTHGCLDVLGALEAEGGGTLAQMVLPRQISVALQGRPDSLLHIKSLQVADHPEVTIPLSAGQLSPDHNWAAGILALFRLLTLPDQSQPQGVNLLIHGDIPLGAGQASSTALLAAVAKAIYQRDNRLPDVLPLAQTIATAEALAGAPDPQNTSLAQPQPSRGHIIDAMTCLHAYQRPPQLLRYSAQPHRFAGTVPLPPEVRVFALDTGVRFTAARDTLSELRIAAAMGQRIIDTIYRDLGQPHTPLHGYLTNTSPLLYRQYFRTLLPRRLRGNDFLRTYGDLAPHEGPLPATLAELDTPRLFRVRTAVDHLIAENEHAEQFLQAMEELADASTGESEPIDPAERQRTLQRAGRLLLASHHSYRLRLELSCREADSLVDSLMESGPDKGVYGARITGVGGGGTVVALLDHSPAATDALLTTLHQYHQQTGLTLGVTEA